MKTETRNPKAERSPKFEVRSPRSKPATCRGSGPAVFHVGCEVTSAVLPPQLIPFGLRVSAFLRPSGFGLRLFPLLALLLAGCAVGPNYERPGALGTNAIPASFAGATATNAGVWQPAQPSAHLPRGAWWEMFGDAELNRLEGLATTNNQQLAAAFANIQQARALVSVARADYFPQVSADPSFTRQRTSANQFQRSGSSSGSSSSGSSSSGSSTFNTFSVPLDASWELDLWGRVRREVQGARGPRDRAPNWHQ